MGSIRVSIKTRILLGYALPILIFLGFTLWLGVQLNQVNKTGNPPALPGRQ